MNVKNVLKKSEYELLKSNISSASIDALVLLEKATIKPREYLIAHPKELITNSEYSKFRRLIRRRKKGEPIAYIVSKKEFFGYDFFVNKNVLIPRPETELLIENALQFIKKRSTTHDLPLTILDIGTGSGCIIISLVLELYKLSTFNFKTKFFASDISQKALYVAHKNAKYHKANKLIRFYKSDLFLNPKMPKKYDLIIANLPYVSKFAEGRKEKGEKSQNNSLSYEPQKAIFSMSNGTDIYDKFFKQIKDKKIKFKQIYIEIDYNQTRKLKHIIKKYLPECKIITLKDLANKNRALKILHKN